MKFEISFLKEVEGVKFEEKKSFFERTSKYFRNVIIYLQRIMHNVKGIQGLCLKIV